MILLLALVSLVAATLETRFSNLSTLVRVQQKPLMRMESIAIGLKDKLERSPAILFNTEGIVTNTVLKAYQKVGVERLLRCDAAGLNSIVADEMGLGKTLQCLAFLALLPQVHPSKKATDRHVLISPKAISSHWINQRKKFIDEKHLRICDMTNPATSQVRRICSLRNLDGCAYEADPLKQLRIQDQCEAFEDGDFNIALTTPSQLQKNLGTWFRWELLFFFFFFIP
jgi:SNF2 family DNA or RNA helicase